MFFHLVRIWENSRVARYGEMTGVFSTCSDAFLLSLLLLLFMYLHHGSCWHEKNLKIRVPGSVAHLICIAFALFW